MAKPSFDSVKRLMDIFGALLGLALLLPLIPIVVLANALFCPGPLFYRQQRVGRAGRPFDIIKFRSMIPDAEKGVGAAWATPNDARVTAVGKILRRTHLDELPQVINVLKGEMSLIGPRPEQAEFVGQLSSVIRSFPERHVVRPGITGWAQIHQDYSNSIEASREKLDFDLYYVKHVGPRLDMMILVHTLLQMLGFRRSASG